jgi:hypothetical protein
MLGLYVGSTKRVANIWAVAKVVEFIYIYNIAPLSRTACQLRLEQQQSNNYNRCSLNPNILQNPFATFQLITYPRFVCSHPRRPVLPLFQHQNALSGSRENIIVKEGKQELKRASKQEARHQRHQRREPLPFFPTLPLPLPLPPPFPPLPHPSPTTGGSSFYRPLPSTITGGSSFFLLLLTGDAESDPEPAPDPAATPAPTGGNPTPPGPL